MGRTERMRMLAPVLSALAVLALLGGVAVLTRGGPGSEPTPLRLGTSGAVASSGVAAGGDRYGVYRLARSLPDEVPAKGRVHRLAGGSADEADVRRLAEALGLTGAPGRTGDGWRVEGSGYLVVSDGHGRPWRFSRTSDAGCSGELSDDSCHVVADCIPILSGGRAVVPSGDPAKPVACAPALPPLAAPGCLGQPDSVSHACPTPPAAPTAPPPPPAAADPTPPAAPRPFVSVSTARSAARGLLDVLDLAEAAVTVSTQPSAAVVTADPVVGGLPTVDWATTVGIGADGTVSDASGWLAAPVAGEDYPLVSAQAAYSTLADRPRPEICLATPDGSGCLPPPELVVTGARAGLLLSADDGRPVLVPAWLFDVTGASLPVGVVAVDPRHAGTDTSEPVSPVPAVPPG